ncbi:MAG: ATP-grasp domain-containing protein [Planctomycetota bacterium]
MNPLWLIEANVYGVDSQSLQAEIQRQGMTARVVKPNLSAQAPRDLLGAEDVPLDGCVLFLGTLPVMEHLQRTRRWRPGGWCSFEALACSSYYPPFGAFLLNQNYCLLPCSEAVRHAVRLGQQFGRDGQVFVRPNSVRKLFTGTITRARDLEQALASARYDPTELVVIAEPQDLVREWRLLIAHGVVVTASRYYERGEVSRAEGCPREVREFAERALGQVAWRPDPLFMFDVGETPDGLRLVELNSFSCSGVYDCDKAALVSAAATCARKLW